jgi:hypothetical protein
MNKTNRASITPAAAAAFGKGDIDNFLVAATPGGIEAQEAAGQITLCASATLPLIMRPASVQKTLEGWGFKFGAEVDGIFITATFPPGWKKQATDHSMWSDLLDDKGRKRGSIFYKAAFYDRSAHMRLNSRYSLNFYLDGSAKGHYRMAAFDCDTEIHSFGEYDSNDFKGDDERRKTAETWLTERFPEWQSETAYWD